MHGCGVRHGAGRRELVVLLIAYMYGYMHWHPRASLPPHSDGRWSLAWRFYGS